MKTGDLFDPPSGSDGRDDGMRRAIEHADLVEPRWSDRAYRLFVEFARSHRQFMTEAARQAAEEAGFALPPDKRAWGAVAMKAAKAGVVTSLGYTEASDPKVHCNPATLWRSNVCQ
jgi:hypothetical protein